MLFGLKISMLAANLIWKKSKFVVASSLLTPYNVSAKRPGFE